MSKAINAALGAGATPSDPGGEALRRHVFGRLRVEHPGGSHSVGDVTTEWIAPREITLIYPGFLYPGSRCVFEVTFGANGECVGLSALVRSCAHVERARHRVVIVLEEQISPRTLLAVNLDEDDADSWSNLSGRALLLDSEQASWRLLRRYLAETRIEANVCETIGPALDHVKREACDLLIIAGTHWGGAADETLALLREASFVGPAVVIDAPPTTSLGAAADVAILSAPLERDALLAAIDGLLGEGAAASAIHSDFSEDETLAPMLTWYCQHARDKMHELRRAEADSDLARAEQICQTLRDTAPGYGYPDLKRVAEIARIALLTTGSFTEAREDLHAMDHLVRRMRA